MIRKNIIFWLLVVFIFALSYAEAGEVKLTTYYPAPYGEYKNIKTTSDTYLATNEGKVGIGTTAPIVPLHTERNSAGYVAYFKNSYTGAVSSGVAIEAGDDYIDSPFLIKDRTGNIWFRITGEGKVGIGLLPETPAIPVAQLHIRGASSTRPSEIRLTNPFTEANLIDGNGAGLELPSTIHARLWNYETTGDLYFGAGNVERLRILSSGNVGIGTTTPDEKFEVEWVPGGTDVEIGRGAKRTNTTFITLRSRGGIKFYIYPDDRGRLLVSRSKP